MGKKSERLQDPEKGSGAESTTEDDEELMSLGLDGIL
jgi:hypothetical protein